MSLFADNQCATAPLSTVVAPTISDPATGMPRVNQAVVLSTPFMIPIARTYSVWATCNATIPKYEKVRSTCPQQRKQVSNTMFG